MNHFGLNQHRIMSPTVFAYAPVKPVRSFPAPLSNLISKMLLLLTAFRFLWDQDVCSFDVLPPFSLP